jgi:hypothetical protein
MHESLDGTSQHGSHLPQNWAHAGTPAQVTPTHTPACRPRHTSSLALPSSHHTLAAHKTLPLGCAFALYNPCDSPGCTVGRCKVALQCAARLGKPQAAPPPPPACGIVGCNPRRLALASAVKARAGGARGPGQCPASPPGNALAVRPGLLLLSTETSRCSGSGWPWARHLRAASAPGSGPWAQWPASRRSRASARATGSQHLA